MVVSVLETLDEEPQITAEKRAFDLIFGLTLLPVLLPVMALVGLAILILDGAPVLFVSERMQSRWRSFDLYKFRTMRCCDCDAGVSGGDKEARITRTGRFLRRFRLDELPQIFNVIRGDISFVGPRPPLRSYVEQFPEVYAEVLRSRPGSTGLATIVYHRHEERILAACLSAEETHKAYSDRWVPRKAKLDIIYRKNACLSLDLWLLARTVARA